jgi:NADH:ubiquinone oxidoreductase subunit 6 (subunit J)
MVSGLTSVVLFWLLSAVALAGALAVVFVRDVMRMALGLGAFLMAVAGFFAYYGFGFLALAELFVYVGGVLVLVLFAIMLVQRSGSGAPVLESRVDSLAVVSSAAVAVGVFAMVRPLAETFSAAQPGTSTYELSQTLLGRLLPQFEAVGLLLLVSLVAVVVIVGGDRE